MCYDTFIMIIKLTVNYGKICLITPFAKIIIHIYIPHRFCTYSREDNINKVCV